MKATLERWILRLYPKAFRGGTYDPKTYWTHFGHIYREKYHRRFLRGLKQGHDRNVGLVTTVIGKLGVSSALDIGCGYGLFLKALEERYPQLQLHGCDVSPTQVQSTREFLGTTSRANVVESGNTTLPFADKSVDLSYTIVTCIQIPPDHIEAFLKDVFRVTRRYGLFLENRRGYSGWSYHEHDYPGLFKKLGYECLEVAQVKHDDRDGTLYLVNVDASAPMPSKEDLVPKK